MRVYQPPETISLRLGAKTFDLTSRALVMGILNRTRDSFYEPAATFDLDVLFERAARLVDEGADILDVGGVKAGPGDEVDEAEELERVVPVVTELVRRFDVPISIDTWRASVAQAAYAEGACIGNDISGFDDDEYLPVAAAADATVVATHIRLRPRVADPDPHYDDVTATVADFLVDRRQRALRDAVRALRREIEAKTDDVGTKFAELARSMHAGDTPERAIRGQATGAEVEALLEEGVDVLPVPTAPDERN